MSANQSKTDETHIREDDLELYAIGTLEESKLPGLKAHLKTCDLCRDRLLEAAVFAERLARTANPRQPLERRCEVRLPTNDAASVRSLRPETGPRHEARILDVSKSGMRIELSVQVDPGVEIQVQLKDAIAFAEVRYCRPVGDKFHAGVKVIEVVTFKPRRQSDHLY
jgi:predicted anti-sigma-YlaC factor YlaD